jgi:hypothetical protein
MSKDKYAKLAVWIFAIIMIGATLLIYWSNTHCFYC